MTKDDSFKVVNALEWLVDELEQWEVPQTDSEGKFSNDTALGYAKEVLKELADKYGRVTA